MKTSYKRTATYQFTFKIEGFGSTDYYTKKGAVKMWLTLKEKGDRFECFECNKYGYLDALTYSELKNY